jgi:hypothetical protein
MRDGEIEGSGRNQDRKHDDRPGKTAGPFDPASEESRAAFLAVRGQDLGVPRFNERAYTVGIRARQS